MPTSLLLLMWASILATTIVFLLCLSTSQLDYGYEHRFVAPTAMSDHPLYPSAARLANLTDFR